MKGAVFMNKMTAFLISTICFLLGLVLGFLIAPIKKGIQIGNNSGNNYVAKSKDNYSDDDADFCDCEPF